VPRVTAEAITPSGDGARDLLTGLERERETVVRGDELAK